MLARKMSFHVGHSKLFPMLHHKDGEPLPLAKAINNI